MSSRSEIDEAMERYADGDDAAFGELYDRLTPRLLAYLNRLTKDASQVEDLAQATLLQMHRARGSFQRGAAVVPWAYAIARRLFIDEVRKRKHGSAASLDDAMLVSLASSDASPLASVEASQLASVVQATLTAMPESQRAAFHMLKVEGLSVAESAEVLATSETTIKMRAHRAYEQLRAAITARFGPRVG